MMCSMSVVFSQDLGELGTKMVVQLCFVGIVKYLSFFSHVAQGIAEVQLPAVTHRVYLDVDIDGQHIGICELLVNT